MSRIVKGNAPDLMALMPEMRQRAQVWMLYNSPESLCEHVEHVPTSAFWDKASRTSDDYDFYMTRSESEAIAMCRDGWPEGAERAARLRDKIAANAPAQRRYARYGVAGAIPNVPRYLAGNPQHMLRLDNAAARQRPVITLINHIGGLGGVAADCFINKAAVVTAIVDSIESSGYSCHVIALAMSTGNGVLASVAVTVKEPGDHMDIGRAAFALGHASMFRRIVFGARYSDNDCKAARTLSTVDTSHAPVNGTYLLPSMNVNESLFRDESIAATRGLQSLVDSLRQQGCPAFRHDAMAA